MVGGTGVAVDDSGSFSPPPGGLGAVGRGGLVANISAVVALLTWETSGSPMSSARLRPKLSPRIQRLKETFSEGLIVAT